MPEIDFEADAEEVTALPGDNSTAKIVNIATYQINLEDKIANLEIQLKELKAEHQKTSTVDLPEAMTELGIKTIGLKNGEEVSIKPFYRASIPAGKGEEALDWLRDNDHGDLIKSQVITNFSKGEEADATNLLEDLGAKGYSFSTKETVHTQTLQAWLREQISKGVAVPLELFNGFIGQKAKITRKD